MVALATRRALIVHCAEQMPASFSPRLASRDPLSTGRRAIARLSETAPDAVANVAFAPLLRLSARRTLRDMRTLTPPAPAALAPEPRRTGRLPLWARRSLVAVRAEVVSETVREQAASHEVSAVTLPAAASTSDSSSATAAKSGGARGRLPDREADRCARAGVPGGVALARDRRVGAAADRVEARGERARAVARGDHRLRRRAGGGRTGVELHPHAAVVARGRARRAGHARRRAAGSGDVRAGRGHVDRPVVERRAAVDVAVLVEGAHLEGVVALRQVAELLR